MDGQHVILSRGSYFLLSGLSFVGVLSLISIYLAITGVIAIG